MEICPVLFDQGQQASSISEFNNDNIVFQLFSLHRTYPARRAKSFGRNTVAHPLHRPASWHAIYRTPRKLFPKFLQHRSAVARRRPVPHKRGHKMIFRQYYYPCAMNATSATKPVKIERLRLDRGDFSVQGSVPKYQSQDGVINFVPRPERACVARVLLQQIFQQSRRA